MEVVFATTAGPKPDPSHAFGIGELPSKVLLGDTLMANARKPSKRPKTQIFDFYWKPVTLNENMYVFRRSSVSIFDMIIEFVRYF